MKTYREGILGALMDEYERAAEDYKLCIQEISDANYTLIIDHDTEDEDCRSVQTICYHVVGAGYMYANYIRHRFQDPAITVKRFEKEINTAQDAIDALEAMLSYTTETLEGKWLTPDEVLSAYLIKAHWSTIYDIEQLLEHAIVHILRHRRQIERFKLKMPNN